MGFFDKIKKMVGKTGVELEYIWIESPFKFGDPMIKATIQVTATGDPVTVIGISAVFSAKIHVGDEQEEEIILGEAEEDVNDCASVDRDGESVPEFPHALPANGVGSYGYFVDDMDLAQSLAKWGVTDAASAKEKNVRFFFKGTVDIKETVGLFDPELEQEIVVID